MNVTIAQAYEQFKELAADLPQDDIVMLSEEWSNYTDGLTKDGQLTDLQYQHCPGYDEDMPGDDLEYILDAMGVKMESDRRHTRPGAGQWGTGSSHFLVKLSRGSVWTFSTFYSMGSAHGDNSPDLCDVVHSLLTDISCDDDFQGFCDDLGYDPDEGASRAIFKAIATIRVKVAGMFTHSELDALNTLFEDY